MKRKSGYRWYVVFIFGLFMLLHQSDRLLIGPLTQPIIETFGLTKAQMGLVSTMALVVMAVMYPIWGYLNDRYARPKLLALASLIWGSTTWLSAIAPNYGTFLASRATTGIDDSSYPGLYSLVSDYFGPKIRGKVYGLLQLSQPLGYLMGMIAALMLGGQIGWRGVYYITGSLGLVMALAIFFSVRDVPRGKAEPELAELERIGIYRFDVKEALGLFRKPTLLLMFAQGFVGVFPWQVITFWFFNYLETERHYTSDEILFTMAPAVLILAAGYFLGGTVGDWAFKRTPRGRVLVCMGGVLTGAVLLILTMNVPIENRTQFLIMLGLTAVFIPFASPNVISTVYDIALPEVRSTALAVQYFIENIGAALAPWMAGLIADRYSLHWAILAICVTAWLIGSVILAFAARKVPQDILILRTEMQARAERERKLQATGPSMG